MQMPSKPCPKRRTLSLCPVIVALALVFSPLKAVAFWPFTQETVHPAPAPAPAANEAVALRTEIQGLANDLFHNLADADPENGDLGNGVLVCTFVELKKLTRTSSFGRYVAEQLMNDMQQRHYEVVEIRKSRAILLQEKRGEFGLSRNPAEVNQMPAAGAMLTGTYTASKDSIVVNATIIDNRSARLLSSATIIIPRNKLAEQLLADTASVRMEKPEPLYMKKLEL